MLSRLRFNFPIALQSFRANPFHTFLSILGIIIGVGALFSILSLADGMEQMGREQITSTSNLQSLAVQTQQYTTIDDIRIRKDSFDVFDVNHAAKLQGLLSDAQLHMSNSKNTLVKDLTSSSEAAAVVVGIYNINELTFSSFDLIAGDTLSNQGISKNALTTVVNENLTKKLFGDTLASDALGKKILIDGQQFTIIGVLKEVDPKQNIARVLVPLETYDSDQLRAAPPTVVVNINTIESYEGHKSKVEEFLDNEFKSGKEGFAIISYAGRMEQLMEAMIVFRIVMGMIVGISVLVGGIGIMNVLLMSIKERTKEIGVRKALGASPKVIRSQFLLEAMLISLAGCMLGVLLGVIVMSIAVPILQHFTEMPFGWVFSIQTTVIIIIIALLIGILFGTYPAIKAARLDPIDAIRHE